MLLGIDNKVLEQFVLYLNTTRPANIFIQIKRLLQKDAGDVCAGRLEFFCCWVLFLFACLTELEHEMQGSGECKKVEEMVKTWRGDGPGIFFGGLLAGWVGYVALQITAGNTQLWRVFVGTAFFEGASRALQFFLQENPGFFRGLALESRADFLNTCISLLHSSLMSLAGIVRYLRTGRPTKLFHFNLVFFHRC